MIAALQERDDQHVISGRGLPSYPNRSFSIQIKAMVDAMAKGPIQAFAGYHLDARHKWTPSEKRLRRAAVVGNE